MPPSPACRLSKRKAYLDEVIAAAGRGLSRDGNDVLLVELSTPELRDRFFASPRLRGRSDAALVVALQLTPIDWRRCRARARPWRWAARSRMVLRRSGWRTGRAGLDPALLLWADDILGDLVERDPVKVESFPERV